MQPRPAYIHFDVTSIVEWTRPIDHSFVMQYSMQSRTTYIYFDVNSIVGWIPIVYNTVLGGNVVYGIGAGNGNGYYNGAIFENQTFVL